MHSSAASVRTVHECQSHKPVFHCTHEQYVGRVLIRHASPRTSFRKGCFTSLGSRSSRSGKTRAANSGEAEITGEVYKGMFGEWSIDASDVAEVNRYRVGLTVAASGAAGASLLALCAGSEGLLGRVVDLLSFVGAAGMAVSLWEIHIYVSPLKRFVQGLWAVGVASALIIAATQEGPVVHNVISNPSLVWGVGPLFAALTGIAFKEGMCYGKAEAAVLFFVTPALLLGHLTGWVPTVGQQVLLVSFIATFGVFAARKYTQAIKDDIGDKSVFEFQKLPAEEQDSMLQELRRR